MPPEADHILVSMSNFKGSLSNQEACQEVVSALKSLKLKSTALPIGDGGAGTRAMIAAVKRCEPLTLEATGPLGHATEATVLCFPSVDKPRSIYIESADCCGLHLVENPEPMRASSRGLGELIQAVVSRFGSSLQTLYVGLGDSALSDMGMGMLCALGYRFFDATGNSLWGNADGLRLAKSIELPDVSSIDTLNFVILSDVQNPLLGPEGAARIFAPQKGANSSQVSLIEQGMSNMSELMFKVTGRPIGERPLLGASGGLAAAFSAFFKSEVVEGAKYLMDWLHFDKRLEKARLIVTGEGAIDAQTLKGKAPMQAIIRAEIAKKNVVVLCGKVGSGSEKIANLPHVLGVHSCGKEPTPLTALRNKTIEVFSELRETHESLLQD